MTPGRKCRWGEMANGASTKCAREFAGAGCGLTRACSRRAGWPPGSARALPADRGQRNIGWCGRRLEGLQLMRQSLDRLAPRPFTKLAAT